MVVLKKRCPLCGDDLRGDDISRYLCLKCMMLFQMEDLKLSSRGE